MAEVERASTFNSFKGSKTKLSPQWFFYSIVWSPNCPSSCNDPYKLMWERTLPQVFELQEANEIRDCLEEARYKDEQLANKT